MSNCIEMKQVSKDFGTTTVLNKINICVKEGEIFGLLGPSGAGKTTIIKILTGQLPISAGEANIFGVSCSHITDSIYSKIGMVLDNQGLYERLTCYDNLKMFTDIYHINKKAVHDTLEQVGLQEAIKKPVNKLSKGMKQRLVLARAMMHHPKLLFLDEPTSGLDPTTASDIHELIESLRENGTTVFLNTHNMAEATKLCDQIGLLHKGNIIELGSPEEICRKHNSKKSIYILLKNGETVELPNDNTISETVANYFRQDSIESIHSSEPNLETVFINLTGRKLV